MFYISKDQNGVEHPYELEFKIVPQEKISKRLLDDILGIYNQSLTAIDRVNLAEKWKGKMKKYEKLKRCVRNLIRQNIEDHKAFDMSEVNDLANKSSEGFGDEDKTIEVTLEDLFEKLSIIWDVKPRGRKREKKEKSKVKSSSKKSNKI